MMDLHTKKQKLYFKEVIRLHYEHGYGEDRISRILPIGHTTVSRWISIFARENAGKSVQMRKSKLHTLSPSAATEVNDVTVLQAEVVHLQSQLKHERLRAAAYDEMINVAESKFKIAIRKKAGAKR
jgi:DNA-binding transcriptional regulator LsrR (DeoR family)